MSNQSWQPPQNGANNPWASQDPNWRPTQFHEAQGRDPRTPFGQQPTPPPNWEDLTPQNLAAVAACGSKQASYEKMHFDQHDVFSSLYFIDRHLPLPRLKEVVNELFADASCGRIMRIKGFTSDGNGWLELNASRDAMTLKPIAKAQEVIIVIGEQLNRAAIEAHWKEV